MSLSGHLEGGVHHLDIRIYYEDTDFSGIVYHANYLKFCERGRSDMLRLAGVHHTDMADRGIHFVVRRMRCDFRASARIDDLVRVETSLKRASGAKLVLAQAVKLADQLLFEAEVTLAVVNSAGRPQRIPPEMVRTMSQA